MAVLTTATLGVRPGFWRGSTTTDEVYECPRKENCKGGTSTSSDDAAPTGDALCASNSKDLLCNACGAGHYALAGGHGRSLLPLGAVDHASR